MTKKQPFFNGLRVFMILKLSNLGMIEMYDKLNDKYTIIDEHTDDVIATVGGFKVNLSTDMIMYEKENRLLIKKYDKFPIYNIEM